METIGKYQVGRLLGRGGMGTVYEATDPVINRKVALKTMIPELAETGDLRARFLREAQAAGGLRHRNIVTVYDLGEDRGQPFIAMEFIEGTDLERIIQTREVVSLEWKLDVLRQICEGLAYAHRNGIVHRDIKPANIRVTPDGDVKIMDFGIAHLQSSTMTKSGHVLGTVHYMAPEQVEGKRVDHRADIFSVGAIAYELLAYKKPFEGDSLTAVMFKIMRDRPDAGALPHSDYSPGLERIIMKALARDLGERYQELDELHDDLARLVRETAPRLVANAAAMLAAVGSGGTVRKGEREMADLRAEMERARADGQFQKALGLGKRLLELDPGDAGVQGAVDEIQAAISDREVEQMSGMALGYAADGDIELAQKIAAKIARIAPSSAKYLELKTYLDEESARSAAEALTTTAREHLVLGNLDEARAAAEEALEVRPDHAVAREIRDRATSILLAQEKASHRPDPPSAEEPTRVGPPPVGAAPPSVVDVRPPAMIDDRPAPPALLDDVPPPAMIDDRPAPPALLDDLPAPIAPLLGPPPTAAGPESLQEAGARSAVTTEKPPVAPAVSDAPAPPPAGAPPAAFVQPPRSEAAALVTVALDHFVQNNYAKARKAAEKALTLDPANKKARELMKILGALG